MAVSRGVVAALAAILAALAAAYYKSASEAGACPFHWNEQSNFKAALSPLDLQPPVKHGLDGWPWQGEDESGAETLFLKDAQGVELHVRHWASRTQPPKACLLMVHGFTWHSAYFTETARHLSQAGYAVVTFDLAAHGLSGSVTRARGYHPRFTDWVDEAQLVLQHAQTALYPGPPPRLPFFIYGESLGGAVVLTLLQRAEVARTLRGAVTACAAVEPPPVLPPAPALAVMSLAARAFPLLPVPGDKITSEPEWLGAFGDAELARAAFRHDPMVVKVTRLGSVAAILPALRGLSGPGGLEKASVAAVLVLQGADDVRVRPGSARDVAERVGSPDKEVRVYEGMRHQLLQETAGNKRRVWADLVAWLDKRAVSA